MCFQPNIQPLSLFCFFLVFLSPLLFFFFFSLLTKGSSSLEMHEGVCVDVSAFESTCPFFFSPIYISRQACFGVKSKDYFLVLDLPFEFSVLQCQVRLDALRS